MWYCLKPLKISAHQLLECFVFELELAFEQRTLPLVIHVVGLLLKWIEDYVEDFGADLLSKLVDLCHKWRPLFLSLCSFDFSSQILFQLYRKLAWVLKDLKREIDSRHFTPLEPESIDQEDVEEAGQNEPADASRLLAMALAVAVSEAPKSAASQDDEVARAIIALSKAPTSSDIAAASNALDQPGLCTCILLELGPQEIANILTKSFFDTFCNIPPRDFARKALGEPCESLLNVLSCRVTSVGSWSISQVHKSNTQLREAEPLDQMHGDPAPCREFPYTCSCGLQVLMEGRLEFRCTCCCCSVDRMHDPFQAQALLSFRGSVQLFFAA